MKKVIAVLCLVAVLSLCGCAQAPRPKDSTSSSAVSSTQSDSAVMPMPESEELSTSTPTPDSGIVGVDKIDGELLQEEYRLSVISELMKLGFTVEEATNMQGLFLQMGIYSLTDIAPGVGQGIDELQSFVAVANNNPELQFYFTVENRVMFYAGFRDEDLYDSENGGILMSITDVYILETDVDVDTFTALQIYAEDA